MNSEKKMAAANEQTVYVGVCRQLVLFYLAVSFQNL